MPNEAAPARVALVFFILALGIPVASAQTLPGVSLKNSVPHITASGTASADVVPDEALISLGVMVERPTAQAASAEMATAASDVVAEAKASGIDPKDIKTASANLTMVYDDERDPSGRLTKHVMRGYQASEDLAIRVRDVKKAGGLARSLVEKGANLFHSISFDYSKEAVKRRELQADAMRDALAEAQSYTNAIGLKLGRVIQIGNDPSTTANYADLPSRPMPRVSGKSVSSVPIPVEPGVETISAAITVTWELEGPR
jgi:uncharacterized protein YggE